MYRSWDEFFAYVGTTEYGKRLKAFIKEKYSSSVCYPPSKDIFRAFRDTPLENVKAIIVGQDPYPNPGQAMGLCFSVPEGVEPPPSLKNIYRELEMEGFQKKDEHNGDISGWAKQGVLLLNAYLSVDAGNPGSHRCEEYDLFQRDVFSVLNHIDRPVVFLFWGSFARKFAKYCDNPRHLVLFANHPSPLSANRGGWFGCGHFKKTNEFLLANGQSPIDW